MSEDEEWTPPTEAELKVFFPLVMQCANFTVTCLGCISVYWNTDTHRSQQLYQCILKHRQTQRLHQVLAARRERSDKISKLMGDYMLKVNCVYPRRRSEFFFWGISDAGNTLSYLWMCWAPRSSGSKILRGLSRGDCHNCLMGSFVTLFGILCYFSTGEFWSIFLAPGGLSWNEQR